MSRASQLVHHIRKGTLVHRLSTMFSLNKKETAVSYVDFPIGNGLKLRLYNDSKLSELIRWANFEQEERQFLKRFLRGGDVFVDVGANVGLFTLEAAALVGQIGKVYSFEPAPVSFRRLLENIELNELKNVHIYCNALSDNNGSATLRVSTDGYDAWSSLGRPIAGASFNLVQVRTMTWTEFILREKLAGRVSMAKIDVEGWESRILQGGTDELMKDSAPVLQVEFTQEAALSAGSSCADLYDTLDELGYALYFYDSKANRLIPENDRKDYAYKNLYAVKDLNHVMERLCR